LAINISAVPREVYESSGFMDALTTSYVPAIKPVKKKKVTSNSKSGNGPLSPTSPPTSPQDKDKPTLPSVIISYFYYFEKKMYGFKKIIDITVTF
jgi:hypothetical protein